MAGLVRQQIRRPGAAVASASDCDIVRSIAQAAHPAARILGMQQALGNQAVQQRASTCPAFPSACPTGGACHTCPAQVQTKLTINQPGGMYEQGADQVAEAVMRMPRTSLCIPSPLGGEGRVRGNTEGAVPPIVHEVLRSSGQPLDPATRTFMESRFGADFNPVRIHTDAAASTSAESIQARGYTLGRDIVFASGEYRPGTLEGKRLLAHELAHVIQQGGGACSLEDSQWQAAENLLGERNKVGSYAASPSPKGRETRPMRIQRKLTVEDPKSNIPNPGGKGAVQTNAKTIEDYLKTLCPDGAASVKVDPGSGAVNIDKTFCSPVALPAGHAGPPSPAPAMTSKFKTGCTCICDLTVSAHAWKIEVNDVDWPHTVFDDAKGSESPGTGTAGKVTTPSPNSPKLWGAATAAGKELDIDPWLVLGHELCGHAWLGDRGEHGPDITPPRGEGGHQRTVARENLLRAEHGIDLRGTFKDPYCGESYWRDKTAPAKVNWSSFLSVCLAWRNKYNKVHGTKYKIEDKIP